MRSFLAPVGLLAIGVLIFAVLRDAPHGTCEQPASRAALDDYRSGLRWLANLAALVTALIIDRLRPGRATTMALVAATAAAVALNLAVDGVYLGYLAAILAAVPALVAMGVLAWLGHRAAREVTALRLAAAYQWLFLVIVIPGGVAVVMLAGEPVCLS